MVIRHNPRFDVRDLEGGGSVIGEVGGGLYKPKYLKCNDCVDQLVTFRITGVPKSSRNYQRDPRESGVGDGQWARGPAGFSQIRM